MERWRCGRITGRQGRWSHARLVLLLQVTDAVHGALVHEPNEQDKQAIDDHREGRRSNALAEGQRVIYPMDDDGHRQYTGSRQLRAVAKMALAVKVTHGTCNGKVCRNSGKAAYNAGAHPVAALQQIQDILGRGKSQSHAGGIDDTV